MKASELCQQSKIELQTTLTDLYKKQFQLKMRHGSDQLPTNHLLREVRRDIARVKTVIHQIKGE